MKVRVRGEKVRSFILENVTAHPRRITALTADHFGITRQAVNKHIQRLVAERVLVTQGKTTRQSYALCPIAESTKTYTIVPGLAEDVVWRQDVAPFLGRLPENVLDIWHYGFTEMFNNAIDHSGGTAIVVAMKKTAKSAQIAICDDGIGIFKKIQEALGLLDVRDSVLELAKGKLTTDPGKHTGEGIFFTSRMFDDYRILSSGAFFSHAFGDDEDWVLESSPADGTSVTMHLNNHTARTASLVFLEFQTDDDIGFTKTVVPVRLAQYGDDKLISRSQAKRLLVRVDRFKTVLFDFNEVASIGQAFADEIFRVFRSQHPEIDLYPVNANVDVQDMIVRAQSVDFTLQASRPST